MIDLYQECADIVNQVPKGMVTTYGAVARALGDDIAKRAVGVMLNTYGPPIKMPCHRVVYSGGGLGGFAYGLPSKVKLLAGENVEVKDDKIYNFENIFFNKFKTTYPLKKARKEQLRLAGKVKLKKPSKLPDLVLGLDASYLGTRAFAAGVLYSVKEKRQIKLFKIEDKINWPYVPTYLGFREIPAFRPMIEHLNDDAVLMLDGNGILHPFGFGIACHIGVETGMPSVGAAKSLLCGRHASIPSKQGANRPVLLGKRGIGAALRTSERGKPIYISPGHLMDMETAVKLTASVSRLRIPEPIRLAHIEATAMRRSRA
jgi:deoxyribonuclease V